MHHTPRTYPWSAGFVAASLLAGTLHAQQGPSLLYSPPPGAAIFFPVSGGTPVQSSITVVPVGGAPGVASSLSCLFRPPVQTFTVQPNVSSFTDTEGVLTLGCTPSFFGQQVGTLVCLEFIPSGPQTVREWPLVCTAFDPSPVFSSIPANGQTIVLGAAPGAQAIGGPVFGNPGLLSYTVYACAVTGSGFTLVSTQPLNVPVGGSVPLDVACTTPAQAGMSINGSLSCQTITGVNPSYPLQCTAIAPPPDLVFGSSFEADDAPRLMPASVP